VSQTGIRFSRFSRTKHNWYLSGYCCKPFIHSFVPAP